MMRIATVFLYAVAFLVAAVLMAAALLAIDGEMNHVEPVIEISGLVAGVASRG